MNNLILLISLLTFSAIGATTKSPSLEYSDTLNKSMSKYQRINHIENYLNTLAPNINGLNEIQKVPLLEEIKVLKIKLEVTERRVFELESKFNNLQKKILTLSQRKDDEED